MVRNRLIHSPDGFLKSLQISQTQIAVFIEGTDIDPIIYSYICSSVCSELHVNYEIHYAYELKGYRKGGGKPILLDYFHFLKNNNNLVSDLDGKTTKIVFFLDKDIDDFRKKIINSFHIIYTRYYEIENEVYLNGNLLHGTACDVSCDKQLLEPLLNNSIEWCANSASKWKNWVILCWISLENNIGECSYGAKSSKIHSNTGNLDPILFEYYKGLVAKRLGINISEFQNIYDSYSDKVNQIYSNGNQDMIFKGKWYVPILRKDIYDLTKGYKTITNQITNNITATLSYSDEWTQYYKEKLRQVICNT